MILECVVLFNLTRFQILQIPNTLIDTTSTMHQYGVVHNLIIT